jgi:hypothetical protein
MKEAKLKTDERIFAIIFSCRLCIAEMGKEIESGEGDINRKRDEDQ